MGTLCTGVVFVDKARGFGYVFDVMLNTPNLAAVVTLIAKASALRATIDYTAAEIRTMCLETPEDDTSDDIVDRGFYVKKRIIYDQDVRLGDILHVTDSAYIDNREMIASLIHKRTSLITTMLFGTYKVRVDNYGKREVINLRSLVKGNRTKKVIMLEKLHHSDVLPNKPVVRRVRPVFV